MEHILKTNFSNYPKGERIGSYFEDFLGRGLFISDGEIWKVHRKVAAYELNNNIYKSFIMRNVAIEIDTRLFRILERASESGSTLDFQDVLERFGFDNVFKSGLDVDIGCLEGDGTSVADDLMRAYKDSTKLTTLRCVYPSFLWKLKKFLNLGSERRLKEALTTLHGFVDNIIRSKLNEVGEKTREVTGDDLMSRLMVNDVENMAEYLNHMLVGFVFAAQDTMTSALTCFFWLISSSPKAQQNILKELESIRVRNGKNIGDSYTADELRDMHYLQASISETMRLYPPAPTISRTCLNDDVLPDGTFVQKEATVMYNSYAMGRMESIWGKNCDEFRPERWLVDGIYQPESPFRYPIFHAGNRMCVAIDLAYSQMKSVAAAVIERFEISLEKKETGPNLSIWFTLGMEGGLPVKVRARKS